MTTAEIFKNTGFYSNGYLNLTPRQAYKEFVDNKAVLLDVRDSVYCAFKRLDVAKVIFLPFDQLKTHYNTLPKNKILIIADSSGIYNKDAMLFLKDKGFENIANLAGGIIEWERDGLPIQENIEERLSGSCMCQLRPRHKTNKKLNT